jgi:hypothetical protein
VKKMAARASTHKEGRLVAVLGCGQGGGEGFQDRSWSIKL